MSEGIPASARNHGRPGVDPRVGRFPGEGNGNSPVLLAWRIQRQKEPGGLQFTGRKVGHD